MDWSKGNVVLLLLPLYTGLSCQTEWKQLVTGCYMFGERAQTFADARNFCLSQQAKLVEIETAEENSAITDEILRQGGRNRLFWLGLVATEGQGLLPKTWVYDSTKRKPEWAGNWHAGQDQQAGEYCAFLWSHIEPKAQVDMGTWHDMDCRSTGFKFPGGWKEHEKTFLSLTPLCEKPSCNSGSVREKVKIYNDRSRDSSSTEKEPSQNSSTGPDAAVHRGPRDETIVLCVAIMAVTVIVSVLIVTLAICLQKRRVVQNTLIVDDPNPMYGKYYREDGEGHRIQSTELRDNNSNYATLISSWVVKIRDNNSGYLGRNDSRNSAIKNLAHK